VLRNRTTRVADHLAESIDRVSAAVTISRQEAEIGHPIVLPKKRIECLVVMIGGSTNNLSRIGESVSLRESSARLGLVKTALKTTARGPAGHGLRLNGRQ
jgi:hypothetical protein